MLGLALGVLKGIMMGGTQGWVLTTHPGITRRGWGHFHSGGETAKNALDIDRAFPGHACSEGNSTVTILDHRGS